MFFLDSFIFHFNIFNSKIICKSHVFSWCRHCCLGGLVGLLCQILDIWWVEKRETNIWILRVDKVKDIIWKIGIVLTDTIDEWKKLDFEVIYCWDWRMIPVVRWIVLNARWGADLRNIESIFFNFLLQFMKKNHYGKYMTQWTLGVWEHRVRCRMRNRAHSKKYARF